MNGPLLSNRRFVQLWIGQTASFIGDGVSMVALVILVVETTGSASAVGGALVARLLPTLASPFFGVLADRLDRRVILVSMDLVRALLAVTRPVSETCAGKPNARKHRKSRIAKPGRFTATRAYGCRLL